MSEDSDVLGMGGMWNNPFVYLVWIWAFRMFGNGWGADSAATQGALTRADLTDGLNFQTLNGEVQGVADSVNALGSSLQTQLCSGFSGVNANVNGVGNAITAAITTASYNNQLGTCEINRNIDSVRYELAQNFGILTNTIHSEAEATRQALIDQQIQDLRDSRESVQRELQSAQLTLANAAQTQNILGSIGRYVPYAGCGSTCGCSSW